MPLCKRITRLRPIHRCLNIRMNGERFCAKCNDQHCQRLIRWGPRAGEKCSGRVMIGNYCQDCVLSSEMRDNEPEIYYLGQRNNDSY